MTTYLAFLRAINLGPTRKFPKADIATATEAAGFTDVATHINTGNVRFETRMRSRTRIEEALEAAYLADRGFEVPTIAFTAVELRAIVGYADEVGEGHAGRQYVSLLKSEPSAALAATLTQMGTEQERVFVTGRAVHLLLDVSYIEARLSNATVEKRLGVATNRNLTVLRAMVQKWC